jgi:hypothetical protein
MTRLIGTTWKRSNALSEGVLIARFLLGNLEIISIFKMDSEKILMLVFELTVLVVCRRGHTSSHSEQRS